MNSKILQQYKDFVWGKYANKNTRQSYWYPIKLFLEYIQKPLVQVAQEDVNKYIQFCFENYKHNGNANRFWAIRQFLNWSGINNEGKNIIKISLPKLNPIDAGKQALNEKETAKIFDTIEELSPLHRLVFYLEYDTIRRPSEVRDVKLTDRYGYILKYRGKTEHRTGIKQCVMTNRLINAWDDYLKIRPIPATEKDSEYLILNHYGQYGGRRMQTNEPLLKIVREIAMYSQIEVPNGEKPTNYLMKRTSITRQLKACKDPKIIQIQAGHSKLETTMKYNRINEEDIKEYLDIFEHKSSVTKEKLDISRYKRFK